MNMTSSTVCYLIFETWHDIKIKVGACHQQSMDNRIFYLAFTALFVAFLVSQSPQQRLLILLSVENHDVLSSSKVQNLGHLEALLKVQEDMQDHLKVQTKVNEEWDYVLVTKAFKEKSEVLTYTNKLQKLPFVHGLKTFVFETRPWVAKAVNAFLAVKKAFYDTLGWLPSRPLKANANEDLTEELGIADLLEKQCSEIVLAKASKEDILVVNVLKIKDQEAMKAYQETVFHHIFPVITTRVDILGQVNSDYWDSLAIVRYRDQASFCEFAHSEALSNVLHFKQKAVQDSYTLLTTSVQ
jgi:hypothetical protein